MNDFFNLFKESPASSDDKLTPHNSDKILGESVDYKSIIHRPEDLNESFVSLMQSMPMGKELDILFISVANEKGRLDLCEEINQPKKVYFEGWEPLIYVGAFIINGMVVYRGISQIVSDLPISADPKIVGFVLAGALGTFIEISLGKIIFSKVSVNRFFRFKQQSLFRERRNDGRLFPVRKAKINGKIRFLNDILHSIREKNVRGMILTWFDLVIIFCCLVGLGIDAVGAIRTMEELLRSLFAGGKTPVEILWLQYLTAALPVIMVVLISMILGNLIYFPQDLNYVLDLFKKKAKSFDYDELRYRISCNNSLCTAILSNPEVSKKEVDIIKIKHEIEHLRDSRDKFEITFSNEICRINHASDDEDSEKGIDRDTKNELLKQQLQRSAELKREKFSRQIQILEKALRDLENEDASPNKNQSSDQMPEIINHNGNSSDSNNGADRRAKNGKNNGGGKNGRN
jgi:hypothetical protein